MGKKNRKNNVAKPKRFEVAFNSRPFADLALEGALVALQDLIPAGTLTVRLSEAYEGLEVQICSLLPGMAHAMVREDGLPQVAMQIAAHSADAGHDLAQALVAVAQAAQAQQRGVVAVDVQAPGPSLAEVLVDEAAPVQIHAGVEFWFAPEQLEQAQVQQILEQSSAEMVPTAAVEGIDNAYWVSLGRPFVRWVRTEEGSDVLSGLARLHAARELTLGEGTKFAGYFRTCGLLIPVWELPEGTTAADLAKPMAELGKKLTKAIASTEALTFEERKAKEGLITREVNL